MVILCELDTRRPNWYFALWVLIGSVVYDEASHRVGQRRQYTYEGNKVWQYLADYPEIVCVCGGGGVTNGQIDVGLTQTCVITYILLLYLPTCTSKIYI